MRNRAPAILLLAAGVLAAGACRATPIVSIDLGFTRLRVGDSTLVGAVYGHRHPGVLFFREDVHAASRDDPTRFVWSLSDSMVAAIDGRGMVRALRPGTTRVSVRYGAVTTSNTATVEVVP